MLSQFALEGFGVLLEPLALEHAPALAETAAGDRSSYGYTWVPDGLQEARAWVEGALAARDSGRQVPFAVRDARVGGRVAGSTRFLGLEVFSWPPDWPPGAGPGDPSPAMSSRRPWRRSAARGMRPGRSART